MTHSNSKAANVKDKAVGGIKENIGKVTNNEQLELEGKIQSIKADVKGKINARDNVHEIKEGVAGKINDGIDKTKDKK